MNSVEPDTKSLELKLKEEKEFWTKRLAVDSGRAGLPLDRKRPEKFLEEEDSVYFVLPETIHRQLTKITNNSSFLTYIILLATVKICLLKYTRVATIAVGAPAMKEMNRANALPIIDTLDERMTFRDLLQTIRETLLQAYRRQLYPITQMIQDLGLQSVDNRCPLFDIVITLDSLHGDLPPLKNDLTLCFAETQDHVEGEIRYRTALYRKVNVERFRDHFLRLLGAGLQDPNTPIHSLAIMGEEERFTILREWGYREPDYQIDTCVHEFFERQVERSPNAVAVIFDNQHLTYRQLNNRANKLTHFLRRLNVCPESFVGICLERSIDLVVAILAVLKAGAAYVPLDPDYPKERLALMVQESGAEVVLSHQHLRERLPGETAQQVFLDMDWDEIALEDEANANVEVSLHHAAYVLYTSGSTGRPKGVTICHETLSNHMLWFQREFNVTVADRVMQRTSSSFDASVWEFFTPLMVGGQLILARPHEHVDSIYLLKLIAEQQISIIQLVPSVLRMLINDPCFHSSHSLRLIFCGGEALPTQLLNAVVKASPAEVCNLYGPTEATIDTIFWRSKDSASDGTYDGTVPIGRPVSDCRVYLLNDHLELVPMRATGEIFIGGNVLARGYIKQPDLTAEGFIPDPFSREPGARMYRTGDLARYLDDGNIQFLDRRDNQVKLRGHRIELNEIEATLKSHPAVQQAIVVLSDNPADERRLLSYVVPQEGVELTSHELREYTSTKLPAYMVPSQYVLCKSFPLLANGKVDRVKLSCAQDLGPALTAGYVAPLNELEQTIANLWQETIPVAKVGRNENFFDLGGHSLSILQVRNKLRRILNTELSIVTLFQYPTVGSLAEYLINTKSSATAGDLHANSEGLARGKKRLKQQLQKAQSRRLQVQHD